MGGVIRKEIVAVLILADPKVLGYIVEAMMPRDELVAGSWICWGSGWCHNFPFINS